MANTKDEKQTIFMLPRDLHTQLKMKCVSEGVSLKQVLVKLVEEYVKQENKNN